MRENGNARAGADLGEFGADSGGDVVAGIEVSLTENVIGEGTVNEDFRAALDERLNLGLPLFGPDVARGGEHGEYFFRAIGVAQEFIERTARGNAFATFAGENDSAFLLDDSGGGAHAFDALVEIEVEGVATVGGDNHVEGGLDLLHGRTADKFVAGAMGFEEVACEDAGDLALFVETNVEEEAWADAQGEVANFFPDGVADGHAESGARVADIAGIVIAHDGFETGATGHNSFGAAAEPGEEMGFDKTGDDPDVGLGEGFVDEGRDAAMGDAELFEGSGVLRFVIDDAVITNDFGREELLELGLSIGAVGAKLVEQGDLLAWNETQIVEEPGN